MGRDHFLLSWLKSVVPPCHIYSQIDRTQLQELLKSEALLWHNTSSSIPKRQNQSQTQIPCVQVFCTKILGEYSGGGSFSRLKEIFKPKEKNM